MRSLQKLFLVALVAVALHLSLQKPTSAVGFEPQCPPRRPVLCSCPDGTWTCVASETQCLFCGN